MNKECDLKAEREEAIEGIETLFDAMKKLVRPSIEGMPDKTFTETDPLIMSGKMSIHLLVQALNHVSDGYIKFNIKPEGQAKMKQMFAQAIMIDFSNYMSYFFRGKAKSEKAVEEAEEIMESAKKEGE